MKKSLKNMGSNNNYERSSLKKSYFMHLPMEIKGNTNFSKNNVSNLYPPKITLFKK